jgi:hypothetical protein
VGEIEIHTGDHWNQPKADRLAIHHLDHTDRSSTRPTDRAHALPVHSTDRVHALPACSSPVDPAHPPCAAAPIRHASGHRHSNPACLPSSPLHHLVRHYHPYSSQLHPHVRPRHPLLPSSRVHPIDEQERIQLEVENDRND